MRLSTLVGGAAEVIGREATLAEAADRMIEREVDCLAVVDGRNLVGVITERDLVASVAEGADAETASVDDWMSEGPDTFSPDVSVKEAAAWLLQTGYRHLPVMADGELLGIVDIRDLVFALLPADEVAQE